MPRSPHDAPAATDGPPAGARGNGNGHAPPGGPDGRDMVPRRPAGPSTRPALVVVGIAALVLLIGGIGAALTSSGSAQPAPKRSLPTAPGAGIKAIAGRAALAPIIVGGQPPGDILNVMALPTGTSVKAGSATDNGIGLYDHSLSFSIPVSDQKLINFFRAELKALKWQIVSQGPPAHGAPGYEIVGQHPSSDGYEWEIGVTVAPTTFGTTAGQPADTTSYTVRLFAVTDD